MEKICIVKRRKLGFGSGQSLQQEVDLPEASEGLTLQLTAEQMEQIRSNDGFRSAYGSSQAPIFLTLRLESPLLTKMLRSDQVCDMLQISKSTLRKIVRSGALRARKIGRLVRFASEDVMEYLTRGVEEVGLLRSVRRPAFMRTWEK